MPLKQMIQQQITGIRPFNELVIDDAIWREAHAQHTRHRLLHNVATHRPGIIYGLEVFVSPQDERSVIVAPGVAVDADGNTLLVNRKEIKPMEQTGQIYILLAYNPGRDPASLVKVASREEYYRRVEGYSLIVTNKLPEAGEAQTEASSSRAGAGTEEGARMRDYVELARVYRTPANLPVREASNPFDPDSEELNLLHRPIAFPHCYADTTVAELQYVPNVKPAAWKPNRAGLWNLLREGNGRGFHLQFGGQYNLSANVPDDPTSVLYMAGTGSFRTLTDGHLIGLQRFLDAGGLLFGEASGGNNEFAEGFQQLARQVGANLTPVSPGHPLLSAQYMFAVPPPGAQENGKLLADLNAGVVFSTFDYGAAWQGEVTRVQPMYARELIRQAQEFGLNIIALAAQRRRRHELNRF